MMQLVQRLQTWLTDNQTFVTNTGTLIGTALVNSAIGFGYWYLAARWFDQAVVGLASAAVSAMILLGSVAMMGLGTLLVSELAKHKDDASSLLATGMIVITAVSIVIGLAFAYGVGSFSDNLSVLIDSPLYTITFIIGIASTAITLMLDQAFIGLLRGGVQLSRNTLASVLKLLALILFGLWMTDQNGLLIFGAWVISTVLSLLIPLIAIIRDYGSKFTFQWHFLKDLGRSALNHHWLNLALDTPIRLIPIIVAIVLSKELTASFYMAWMLAGLLFYPVQSLTLVLYAVGSQDISVLAEKMRLTLRLSIIIAIVGYVVTFLIADLLLGIFGENYALQAADTLRIVSIAIFLFIIRDHYIAVYRITERARYAAKVITVASLIEVIFATIGALYYGLVGLSIAWIIAVALEVIYMLPIVIQTIRQPQSIAISSSSNLSQERG